MTIGHDCNVEEDTIYVHVHPPLPTNLIDQLTSLIEAVDRETFVINRGDEDYFIASVNEASHHGCIECYDSQIYRDEHCYHCLYEKTRFYAVNYFYDQELSDYADTDFFPTEKEAKDARDKFLQSEPDFGVTIDYCKGIIGDDYETIKTLA